MPPRKLLGEVFGELPKKVKHQDKIDWLRANAGPPLFYILSLAFREDVKFALPEGAPPFTPWKGRPGSEPSELLNELKRLYLYIDGQELGLRTWKRELQFQRLLESVPAVDAKALIAVKDKTFAKEFRCPLKVIEEAFPGLLTHPFSPRFAR